MIRVACLALALLQVAAGPSMPGGANPLSSAPADLVRAELVSDVSAVQPGSSFRLGVHLVMKEGWHVNWINPGDAGLAPSIAWKLPAGFKATIVEWPLPFRFLTGPLAIFGYTPDVLLVSDVRVPADLPAGGNVELAADVSWLACAEECVPGSASVRLQLPVEKASRPNVEAQNLFASTETRLPARALSWKLDAWIEETKTLVIEVQSGEANAAPLSDLFFFPYDPGLIDNAAPQPLSAQPGPGGTVYQLRVERSRMPAAELTRAYGLLVASSGLSRAGGPAAIEINIPLSRR